MGLKQIFLITNLLLICCQLVFGETIQSERGPVTVENGDTLRQNSAWTGTIENLDDVTFIEWNFSRSVPHTVVFMNCTNLKFIDCNLNNVELQADFEFDGSLTIHQKKYEIAGIKYKEVECGDNKIRTWRIDDIFEDDVEDNFPDMKQKDKDKLKQMYQDDDREYQRTIKKEVLIDEVETPSDKKIQARKSDLSHLRK